MASTEIVIITGFLGSGKSTFLKRILEQEQKNGRRVGVLMNELGEISIDSVIVPGGIPIKELLNGCICCSIQGDVTVQIIDMLAEFELDAIYIEATGVAHPMEIVEAVTHLLIASEVTISKIVTTVDAKQWLERFDRRRSVKKLLEEQVRFANVILLNKADLVPTGLIEVAKAQISQINPNGVLVVTKYAAIGSERMFSTADDVMNGEHNRVHVHTDLHVYAVSVRLQKPIDRDSFIGWLNRIPGKVYRAKGILRLTGMEGAQLFQYAYGMPQFQSLPDGEKMEGVFVLIGEELNAQAIERELASMQGMKMVF